MKAVTKINTIPATTASASLNIPLAVATPSSPSIGDISNNADTLELVTSTGVKTLATVDQLRSIDRVFWLDANDTVNSGPYMAGLNGENTIIVFDSTASNKPAFIHLPGSDYDGATGDELAVAGNLLQDDWFKIYVCGWAAAGGGYQAVVTSRVWTNTDMVIQSGASRLLSDTYPGIPFDNGYILGASSWCKYSVAIDDVGSFHWCATDGKGIMFNRDDNGDGWGNESVANIAGYAKRYTLSEDEYNRYNPGVNKEVAFNDSGILAGDPNFTWDKATRQLELGAAVAPGALGLFGDLTDPVAEPSKVLIYSKNMAGRIYPKWIGPTGIDMPFQPCVGFNGIKQVAPASGTTAATCMTAFATAFVNSATTLTQIAVTSTSIKTRMRSVTLATNTTTGQIASHRSTVQEVCGAGGYFFVERFYLTTLAAGNRGFFGLWGNALVATNVDPLTSFAVAKVGLAFSANTGNWRIVCSTTTAATAVDLGATMPINITDVMELVLFCAPGGTTIGYRVTNITTGAVVTGTLSTNVPATSVAMAVNLWHCNNATGASVAFGLNKWYLESDY